MTRSSSKLIEEMWDLAPWHHDVELMPGVRTGLTLEASDRANVSLIDPSRAFKGLMERVYPGGLNGRLVLDCACNAGGYLLLAKELGAGGGLGFDVREHWIRQALWLQENRAPLLSDVHFAVADLHDLPSMPLDKFDICLFQGIFYHLPDPVAGLRIAADLTSELLIISTEYRNDLPDGMLVMEQESKEHAMSGVHGLNWLPTGLEVLRGILGWLGFVETRLVRRNDRGKGRGRLDVMAARDGEVFHAFDAALQRP